MKRLVVCIVLLFLSLHVLAQNWNKVDTTVANNNVTDTVWRSGSVLISEYYKNPFNNKFGIVTKYDSIQNRGMYIGLNEPDDYSNTDGDSTRVGLALSSSSNYRGLIVNNYANFHSSIPNTDVHNATSEFNYFRGMPSVFGYRDSGSMTRAAVLRLSGTFYKNDESYSNDQFDLLNLRFFTDNDPGNTAEIENFYAVRMEDFRGVNTDMIENGWGVYMKPAILNNYFGGHVGIGTESVSHPLTIDAGLNPLKISGITEQSDSKLLSIDDDGEVHQLSVQALNQNFVSVTGDTTLTDEYYLYIHTGADATYTLPEPSLRTGLTWKIVNTGTGIITFSESYYEGSEPREQLLNKPGNYSIELFSDGTRYIRIE
ncbi:hypothetical protein [Jiulongibacter sp. NS-SX5]|uniref:hypothetical protein n=1 Tax=Jiulongibacter sp. NS-SX5 TaxID=3463854 RepID=UPI004059AE5F